MSICITSDSAYLIYLPNHTNESGAEQNNYHIGLNGREDRYTHSSLECWREMRKLENDVLEVYNQKDLRASVKCDRDLPDINEGCKQTWVG